MMNREEAARRYAERPGFQLISARDAALPLFRVTLRVVVLEVQDIPVVEQFVLRAIGSELNLPREIASFLGVSQRLIDSAIVNLLRSDDLLLAGGSIPGVREDEHRLVLTRKGQRTLEELRTVLPVQVEVKLFIDALTKQITADGSFPRVPGRALPNLGLMEIVPASRWRPDLSDFQRDAVARALGERGLGRGRRQLLTVLSVERRERFFRTDVVALAYTSEHGPEKQVAVVVAGVESSPHEIALAQVCGERWRDLFADDPAGDREIESLLHGVPKPPPAAHTAGIAARREDALAELEGAAALAGERASPAADADEAAAVKQFKDAESALDAFTVRWVEVYEHRSYLQQALREATKRILIVSPWITRSVVDERFLADLEAAMKRGADVYIGYGLGDAKENDAWAVRRLEELDKEWGRLHLLRLGNTHAKVLVCDSTYAIVGSFNWLSFSGDPERTFRDERSTYVAIPAKVDDLFVSYQRQFDVATVSR
jgi:PLD-like domain